jgi:predicted nuclease of restriction endonuclease-like (RecB) superfamily
MKRTATKAKQPPVRNNYAGLVGGISHLLEAARHATVRVTNSLMTATYWEVGRRVVEFEQGGSQRAGYGEELLARLSNDLTQRLGRGFGVDNLENMRRFYLAMPEGKISETLSRKLFTASGHSADSGGVRKISETVSRNFTLEQLATTLPLPWSHYVLLSRHARSAEAFDFYHAEALRGGWSVRQLDRQISSLFYERTALSRNKAALLKQGARPQAADLLGVEDAVRDPLFLEFLDLRDEYSETELEDALIRQLETFLIELGGDFAFVGRQRRLRVDDEWYRVDLIFFHRRLRSLVLIDLKLGKLTHADAGQMHLYLNYAAEHWTHPGENPPVGLILCSSAGQSLVRYTLDALPNKVMAREYRLALPDEKLLVKELEQARRRVERNQILRRSPTRARPKSTKP